MVIFRQWTITINQNQVIKILRDITGSPSIYWLEDKHKAVGNRVVPPAKICSQGEQDAGC